MLQLNHQDKMPGLRVPGLQEVGDSTLFALMELAAQPHCKAQQQHRNEFVKRLGSVWGGRDSCLHPPGQCPPRGVELG